MTIIFEANLKKIAVLTLILIMIGSSFAVLSYGSGSLVGGRSTDAVNGTSQSAPLNLINAYPLGTLPIPSGSIRDNLSFNYSGPVKLMMTFKLQNQSRLSSYLAQLSNRSSPDFHAYITREEFASEYSVSPSYYSEVATYFGSYPGVKLQEYSDRVSLAITAPSSVIDNIFHTVIKTQTEGGMIYYASIIPELPNFISKQIASVVGFSNSPISISYNLGSSSGGYLHYSGASSPIPKAVGDTGSNTNGSTSGYPQPFLYNGSQMIFGSNLQVAYQEQTLLNITYPTNEVVATILWSGNISGGQNVGPYYPKDLYSYFNSTLPSYEPHPRFYGVPINGAPKPGISSTYDTTEASNENTLDIEMVGSTAPGASIYNVYGPTPSFINLDEAFAYILNPNSTFSSLNNVSVISNSWGASDYNDTSWYTYLQEAEARGITVLASSGDSGDNVNSSKYFGTNYAGDYTEFPSSMAYNSFGVTAVGGTTLTLTASLDIANQVSWYIAGPTGGGPAGSTGGISNVFGEPTWQSSTEANSVIQGSGRGVPDIAAIANNTIIYETVNGTSYYYYQNGYFYYEWGTSIACPVVAGLVAEIDSVMAHYGLKNLGYLNPVLYELGNMQVSSFNKTATTGAEVTGSYVSAIPMLPYYDVIYGGNYVNSALEGYDLVTGWGSLYAYNFTAYLLNLNFTGHPGAAQGVQNIFNLSALSVTSYFNSNDTTNRQYNASIQQNFFLANELGAPIYWVQNVIYISYYGPDSFVMTYSGWVIYPFYGQYPNSIVYEYNFPSGQYVYLPQSFDIKSWIEPSPANAFNGQKLYFQVNGQNISLPVPGAAYIIDSLNYNYQWNGESFENGPYPVESNASWGLIPQIGLVGGPSSATGNFLSPTSGTLKSYIEPYGSVTYSPASSTVFYEFGGQTGELSSNLLWSYSNGLWTLSIKNGSSEQGIAFYQSNIGVQTNYNIGFTEVGLPSGTSWSVELNGTLKSSTSTSIIFTESNGSYTYSVGIVSGYSSSPNSGIITVKGSDVTKLITFSASSYQVTFTESGLPSGIWYLNLTNGQIFSTSSSEITFSEPNGTYYYTIASGNAEYKANVSEGNFTVEGSPYLKSISFHQVTFPVTFSESGLPSGVSWYVNITGYASSGPIATFSYSIYLESGSYTFSVSTADKTYSPSYDSSFTVNGSITSRQITFTPLNYSVIFSETGVSSGTRWYVNSTYTERSALAPGNITFMLTNGTYTFSVTNLSMYYSTVHSVTLTVSGSNITESVTYLHWAFITGNVSQPDTTVTINGKLIPLSSNSFNVSVPEGSYSVVVSLTGYKTFYDNFTISSGSVKNLNIELSQIVKPAPGLPSFEIYIAIAVIVLIGIIVSVVAARRRKK